MNAIIAKSTYFASTLALALGSLSAAAVPINWVDWQSSTSDSSGFTAFGVITSDSVTVDVTYNNPLGISFIQTSGGTDYWSAPRGTRDPANSPFTSTGPTGVDNIPTGTDMIALRFAGFQTLTFSEAIANPVFSYISLNGNGYGFDQDFEILSFGDGSAGNPCGWWGCGTSFKDVTADQFQLLGTGEPHGTLRFTGAFDTVTWESLSNENWNGFTVGIQGTADQVFPCEEDPTLPECNEPPPTGNVPEPATLFLFGLGLAGLGWSRRPRRAPAL